MRFFNRVEQFQVWNHWFKIENPNIDNSFTGDTLESKIENWRKDIKKPLPRNISWWEAEIEDRDIIGLYIISSDDWSDISQGSFLVRIVSENLHSNYTNCDSIRLSEDIKKKVSFLKSGSTFDTKFIAVSDSCSGPVTFMEGNRRAVALCYLKRLADVTIYLGITEQITNYQWARHTYRR